MDENEHQARCIAEEPCNELEQALAAVMAEQMSKEDFLRIFLSANLYVLVNSEPKGNTLGDCTPMVISTDAKAPRMLVVFSSPLRSLKMTELHSEYRWPV